MDDPIIVAQHILSQVTTVPEVVESEMGEYIVMPEGQPKYVPIVIISPCGEIAVLVVLVC